MVQEEGKEGTAEGSELKLKFCTVVCHHYGCHDNVLRRKIEDEIDEEDRAFNIRAKSYEDKDTAGYYYSSEDEWR